MEEICCNYWNKINTPHQSIILDSESEDILLQRQITLLCQTLIEHIKSLLVLEGSPAPNPESSSHNDLLLQFLINNQVLFSALVHILVKSLDWPSDLCFTRTIEAFTYLTDRLAEQTSFHTFLLQTSLMTLKSVTVQDSYMKLINLILLLFTKIPFDLSKQIFSGVLGVNVVELEKLAQNILQASDVKKKRSYMKSFLSQYQAVPTSKLFSRKEETSIRDMSEKSFVSDYLAQQRQLNKTNNEVEEVTNISALFDEHE